MPPATAVDPSDEPFLGDVDGADAGANVDDGVFRVGEAVEGIIEILPKDGVLRNADELTPGLGFCDKDDVGSDDMLALRFCPVVPLLPVVAAVDPAPPDPVPASKPSRPSSSSSCSAFFRNGGSGNVGSESEVTVDSLAVSSRMNPPARSE